MTDRAKPTPGPLTLAATPNGAVEVCSGINTVAEFIWGEQYTNPLISRDEALANAKLFMSAPDLLLALKCMEEEMSDYMRINNLGDPGKKHNIRLARAAIERAMGGRS